jgi:hypothetical protein
MTRLLLSGSTITKEGVFRVFLRLPEPCSDASDRRPDRAAGGPIATGPLLAGFDTLDQKLSTTSVGLCGECGASFACRFRTNPAEGECYAAASESRPRHRRHRRLS